MYPGSLVRIGGGGGVVLRAPLPYATPAVAAALGRAASGTRITVNAALRTVVQQYVMRWRWDHRIRAGCVAAPTAAYGRGTHNSGGALDINEAGAVLGAMTRAGFRWGGYWTPPDRVHYYIIATAHDVQAFQHLWNSNHPEDRIAEDGAWGGGTEARMLASPAGGFAHDGCAVDRDGDGSPEGEDCDDADPRRSPRLPEACDGIDNDCNGLPDDMLTRVCGTDEGECRAGIQTCIDVAWGACVGEIPPAVESCDTLDDDCDGAVDEERTCEHDDAAAAALFTRASSDVDGDGRADACMRLPSGFMCVIAGAAGFDRAVRGPVMADEDGWDDGRTYRSVRMGDVDGDGLDDLCARQGDRVVCWQASGEGFDESLVTLPLGEPSPGARDTELWLADVDGDARADLCVRSVDGLRCAASTAGTLALHALADAEGFDDVARHGSIRFGDVDGDGREDVCARVADGLACWLASRTGFETQIRGPRWSDAAGYAEPRYGSTIRLADVDGDGRADACARGPDGFACWLATGMGFGEAHRGPDTREGWDERSVYATLRMGDVDGDGREDVCARLTDGVHCWLWTGESFAGEVSGPALSDDAGWSAAPRYSSLRLADVDGDGRADVCARGPEGLSCWLADGLGFPRQVGASAWSDVLGLGDPAFGATLTIAGPGSERASDDALVGSCACRAGGRRGGGSAGGLSVLVAVFIACGWRKRAARRLLADR